MKKERKILRNCFGNSNKNTIFVVPNRDKDVKCLSKDISNYAFAYPLCSYSLNANSLCLATKEGVRSLFTYFTQLFNLNKMPNKEVKSSKAAKHSTRTTSKQLALLSAAQSSSKFSKVFCGIKNYVYLCTRRINTIVLQDTYSVRFIKALPYVHICTYSCVGSAKLDEATPFFIHA